MVVLHVDHIVAIANGGTNEATNLITACSECNLGKSAVPLGDTMTPIKKAMDIEREKVEQLKAYNKFLIELKQMRDTDFKMVSDAIISSSGQNPNEWVISGKRASSVRLILKRLPVVEILEAVDIANDRIGFEQNDYKAWKYFCGICWRKVDKIEGKE